jgi:hypothetical protein
MPRYEYPRDYSPSSSEQFLREYAFREHITRAWRGDTGPLREYLRDYQLGKVRLTPGHVELLEELIFWRIEKKQRGKRGKGAPTLNPDREGERRIANMVRERKKQRYGNRRLPRGALPKLVDEVMDELACRPDGTSFFDDYQGTISKKTILADLKRGKQKPKSSAQRSD